MAKELNTEEFITEVMNSGQPSVVVFGTDTCGVCIKAKNTILPKWEREHPKFKFYFVNVVKNPEAARLVGIKPPGVPQFLIMVGSEVYAETPFLPKEEKFLEMLALVDKIPKNLPSTLKRAVNISAAFLRMLQNKKLFVSVAVKKARMDICKGCFFLTNGICGNTPEDSRGCGCPVDSKTNFRTEECPRGFWGKEDKS